MFTLSADGMRLKVERHAQAVTAAALIATALAVLMSGELALAGTDTTFDAALNTVADYVSGSAGKLAAIVALAYGMVRMATSGWSLGHVGVPIAVGMTAGLGGPIVQSAVTAVI